MKNPLQLICSLILSCLIIQCSGTNPIDSNNGSHVEQLWRQQNPLPTSNDLLDIAFISDNEAWAISDVATMLHTLDGGLTWREEKYFDETGRGLFFLDSRNGWIVGDNGIILHTRNGGLSWYKQNSNTTAQLMAVYFVDGSYGWAVGSSGVILATKNGGRTWSLQRGTGSYYLRDVLFLDRERGWAIGSSFEAVAYAELLYTSNGGKDWVRVDAGVPVDLGDPELDDDVLASLYAIASASENSVTIVGEAYQGTFIGGIRINTIDGGLNWNVELTNVPHSDICYINQNVGYIAGYGGTILRTEDGGLSWGDYVYSGGYTLYALSHSSNQNICAVGQGGTIVQSSDNGYSWDLITSGNRSPIWDIQFIDEFHGWLAGFDGVFRTDDGGISWEFTNSSAGESVCFINELTGWACDYSGNFDQSTDGGITWQRIAESINTRVWDMMFVDSLHGWAVGWYSILNTVDGGISWNVQYSENGYKEAVYFVDSLKGWVVGNLGVFYTVDGGDSWMIKEMPVTGTTWADVYFADSRHGWIIGGRGVILATTDGGENWNLQSIDNTAEDVVLYSIGFSDSLTGWAVGKDGIILGTNDGGQSWLKQNSFPSAHLNSVYAVGGKAWAGGWFGTILHCYGD